MKLSGGRCARRRGGRVSGDMVIYLHYWEEVKLVGRAVADVDGRAVADI